MVIMDEFIDFSPFLIVVFVFFIQHKIFVTPCMLEKKHREILNEAQSKFASMHTVQALKEQMDDIKDKIDKIYEVLIKP